MNWKKITKAAEEFKDSISNILEENKQSIGYAVKCGHIQINLADGDLRISGKFDRLFVNGREVRFITPNAKSNSE